MSNFFTSLNEGCLIALADYYGARRDRKAGADMYTCPLCKSGEHGTDSTGAFHIGRNKNGKISFYCHSCGRFGNIASLYCEYHGIANTKQNFPQIIRGIRADLGMHTEIRDINYYQDFKRKYQFKGEINQDDLNPQTTVEPKNYSNWFKYTLWKNQSHAVNYLKTRGIENAEKIAYDFNMGYGEYKWNGTDTVNAVFVPMFEDYNFNSEAVYSFSWRAVDQDLKKKRGKIRPLVPECLKPNSKDTTKKWIYLVEGEYDAFSIIDIQYSLEKEGKTCEFSAISINSAGNLSRFIDELYQNGIISNDIGLIIALDNDKEFNQNVENFKVKGYRMAQKYRIPCIIADVKTLYLGEKDSNEAIQKDRIAFEKSLKLTVEQAKLLDINTYMKECEQMEKEIQKQEKLSSIGGDVVAHQDGTQSEQPIPDKVTLYPWDDIGRIDRAKSLIDNTLKYCKFSNMWYKYDDKLGILLKNQTDTFIDDLQRNLNIYMMRESIKYQEKDEKYGTKLFKEFEKERRKAIGERGFQNTLKGLQRQHNIAIELKSLDKPNLLNFKDVTLNLDTLEIIPHSIDNLCTKYIDTNFYDTLDPQAVQDWNNFIYEIMCGDIELMEFLQRLCGYILEVTNKEEFLTIFYGPTTRNGKSTLLYAIQNLFGEYSRPVSSTTLAETKFSDGPKPEILDLIGAKLITCGELNSETMLNDTLLKLLLGRDLFLARGMCSNDMIKFYLDGKIFANCNELPPMKNDDMLNSMRIIVVPFNRHFEEKEQKKGLKDLFTTPKYKAVIWNWIFEGYKSYKEIGIKAKLPRIVKQLIKEYQSESNSINVFLNDNEIFERIDRSNYEECVKLDKESLNFLYPKYVEMCKNNNQKPLAKPNFKKQLQKNRAYKLKGNYNKQTYYQCLCGYKYNISNVDHSGGNPLMAIEKKEYERLKGLS